MPAGVPQPGEIFAVPTGQVSGAQPVQEYRRFVGAQGGPHPIQTGYATLASLFGTVGNVAEALGSKVSALWARDVQENAANAAEQDVRNAPTLADLDLPSGNSVGERAYRETAVLAAHSRMRSQVIREVDALAQAHRGNPLDFQEALNGRKSAALAHLPPALQKGASSLYDELGTSAWSGLSEEARAVEIDGMRADLQANLADTAAAAGNRARAGDYQGAMGMIRDLTNDVRKAGPVATGGTGVFTAVQQADVVRSLTEHVGQEFATGWVRRNPVAAATSLHGGGGFLEALGQAENSGNYGGRPRTDSGAAGKYQMTPGRMAELGFYKPKPGDKPNEWNGEFHNLPGVNSIEDFLKSPQAQEAVAAQHIQDIDQKIDRDGLLEKYGGQVINGTKIDRNAIRGMAHLGGYGGAKAYLETGGGDNRQDSNRTKLSDYARRFAGTGDAAQSTEFTRPDDPIMGPIWDHMAPEQRDQVGNLMERELRQITAEQATAGHQQMVQERLAVEQQASNQLASLSIGQTPASMVTREQIDRAYPDPAQADAKWDELERNTHMATNLGQVSGMSYAQQDAMLAQRAQGIQDPNNPHLAEDLKDYRGLAEAVQKNRNELDTDPAGTIIRTDKNVAAVWEAAQQPNAPPQQLSDAVKATLAAESARGMPPERMRPLPMPTASAIVNRFMTADTTDQALQALMPYTVGLNDSVQMNAVVRQLEQAKLPAGVDIALERLINQNDQAAASEIISVLRVKPEDAAKFSETRKPEIDQAVAKVFQGSTSAAASAVGAFLTGQASMLDRKTRQHDLVQRLTTRNVMPGQSMDVDDAAAAAVTTVYGKLGSVVEPTGIGAFTYPESISSSEMISGMETLRRRVDVLPPGLVDRLHPPGEGPPGPAAGDRYITERLLQQSQEDMRSNGKWVDFNGGYALVDPYTGHAALGSDGQPRKYSLQEIRDAAKSPHASVRIPPPSLEGVP